MAAKASKTRAMVPEITLVKYNATTMAATITRINLSAEPMFFFIVIVFYLIVDSKSSTIPVTIVMHSRHTISSFSGFAFIPKDKYTTRMLRTL